MSQISQAIERQEVQQDGSARAMVQRYQASFAAVLPTHLREHPETFIRIAQGALKKGQRMPDGRFELEVAATNNPGVFLASLLDAARLGLEPGTEQYYLTPRKVKGHLEILGIVGYQGHIELMYRAGAVASVVAEVVSQNDHFTYRPGTDDVPQHEIDWDGDRGELRLVYAFARMKDGAVSKVVVLNRMDIELIKQSSQGSASQYSPWVKHPKAMWLKSAVRQLAKWVPTSAEIRGPLRAAPTPAASIEVVRDAPATLPIPDEPFPPGDIIDIEPLPDNEGREPDYDDTWVDEPEGAPSLLGEG